MPSLEILVAFTFASLLMNLSPGPSNLYVMARSIAQGSRGGIVASLGLASGGLVHVMAAVLGLSALFQHSPTLYTIVKLVGAAYLIYLGVSYWLASRRSLVARRSEVPDKPLMAVFRESIFVEVSNPKTALFFIALLPQFVVPESGPVWQQLLVLGMIVTLLALPCDILVAIFSSKLSNWLITHEHAQRVQQRISGSLLFGMGTFIVADEAAAYD
jgi:threonine/homoserine/homoserine lactone efflux protein